MADEAGDRNKWCYLLGTLALIVAILALLEMARTTAEAFASDPV